MSAYVMHNNKLGNRSGVFSVFGNVLLNFQLLQYPKS